MKDIHIAQDAAMRRIKKANKKKKLLRLRRSKRPKSTGNSKKDFNIPFRHKKYSCVVSKNFSLLDNTEETLLVIENILKISSNKDCKSIFVNMDDVVNIDTGALALLLALVNKLYKQGIGTVGNMPLNSNARKVFRESGFLDHMTDIQGRRFKRNSDQPNMMFERGFDKTSNKKVGDAVKGAVKYLTGELKTYQPVYSIIQEMCANSIEHANNKTNNKNWLFTVYCDKDKVVFTMTDIGEGILGTLKKKKTQEIIETIVSKDDVDVLEDAFNKKYQSASEEGNRNKGLPLIREKNKNGYIQNLKVITNNVCLDFNGSDSKELSRQFKGTFYYWELTKETIQTWRNRSICS